MSEKIAGRQVIRRHLDHGPESQIPYRIIVHSMAYQIDHSSNGHERLYAATYLDLLGLSAHILIAPDGNIIRCREDAEGAWHALGYNKDSLGIEILVPHVHDYLSFIQRIVEPWCSAEAFDSTVNVVAQWCKRWHIDTTPGSLDRHSDVDPERKSDPGRGFRWERFVQEVERMR